MDRGSAAQNSRVLEVFRDIKGRRAGILKALTTGISAFFPFLFAHKHAIFIDAGVSFCGFFSADFEEFYQQCDPGKLFYHYYLLVKSFRVSSVFVI